MMRINPFKRLCLVATALIGMAFTLNAGAATFFVSPDGNDSHSGAIDSPLTLQAAIDKASRLLKEDGLPDGGITIYLREGRYLFTDQTTLGPEFKGTEDSPIVIAAYENESVVFDGGQLIDPTGFEPVTDPEERARLAASARGRIVATTIDDPRLIEQFNSKLILTLAYDGNVYLPSVFPNQGYAYFDEDFDVPETYPPGIPDGQSGRAGLPPHQEPGKPGNWRGSVEEPRGAQAGFAKSESQMAGTWQQWEDEFKRNNTRRELVGFIDANWLLRNQPLVGANAKRRTVHLSQVLSYGWNHKKKDKPFRVFGMLCEIDRPGEWHFDPLTNRLYIYPTGPMTSNTVIGLPYADGFMKLDDTSYVSVIGLDVENVGNGTVFDINGGDHNRIVGCIVRNSTATGVRVTGEYNGVISCDFIDLNRHVILSGGTRSPTEITPGHNYVENCHIYQKNFKHEKVNISMNGVGNRFSNNLVHNSIGQAMVVYGNDQLIEQNEFFNIGFEEGDGGAVYSGADLAGYGNTYRHNFFHHLIHVPGKVERSGIHLDDLQAGSICIGNVFYKSASKGIFMNAGSGHVIRDNVMLEGFRGVYNVAAGSQKFYDRQQDIFRTGPSHDNWTTKENYIGRAENVVGKEGWNNSPWKDKYPLFQKVMNDKGQYGRMWPIYNTVENNIYYGNTHKNETEWSRFPPEAQAKSIIRNDRTASRRDFADYERMDFRFRRNSPKVPDIPFESIGLYVDEYRQEMPKKYHYRNAIRQFFDGIPSHPGTNKQFDSAKAVEKAPKTKK